MNKFSLLISVILRTVTDRHKFPQFSIPFVIRNIPLLLQQCTCGPLSAATCDCHYTNFCSNALVGPSLPQRATATTQTFAAMHLWAPHCRNVRLPVHKLLQQCTCGPLSAATCDCHYTNSKQDKKK